MTPALFDNGVFVFHEGELVTDIFFIIGGSAEVLKKCKSIDDSSEEDVPCAQACIGNFVGHEGILHAGKSQYSVRATSKCSTYSLSKYEALRIVDEHPAVAIQLQNALGKAICRQGTEFERSARGLRKQRMKREASRKSVQLSGTTAASADRTAAGSFRTSFRALATAAGGVGGGTSVGGGSSGQKSQSPKPSALQPIACRLSRVHIDHSSGKPDTAAPVTKCLGRGERAAPRAHSCPFINAGYDDPGTLSLPSGGGRVEADSEYGFEERALRGAIQRPRDPRFGAGFVPIQRGRSYSGPFGATPQVPPSNNPAQSPPTPSGA